MRNNCRKRNWICWIKLQRPKKYHRHEAGLGTQGKQYPCRADATGNGAIRPRLTSAGCKDRIE